MIFQTNFRNDYRAANTVCTLKTVNWLETYTYILMKVLEDPYTKYLH